MSQKTPMPFVILLDLLVSPLEWLAVIGLIILLTLSFSWLASILGLIAKSVEGVQWMTFVSVFPLTFASSAFVDPATMTSWLRPFAENQPITHIVDAFRSLLVGTQWATRQLLLQYGLLVLLLSLFRWLPICLNVKRHSS